MDCCFWIEICDLCKKDINETFVCFDSKEKYHIECFIEEISKIKEIDLLKEWMDKAIIPKVYKKMKN